jgi:hypothetical protein
MDRFLALVGDHNSIASLEDGILAAAINGVVGAAMVTVKSDLPAICNPYVTASNNAAG